MVVKKIQEPAPASTEPWHMLGWLQGTLERKRVITIKDWNDAIAHAAKAKARSDARGHDE